MRLLPAAVGLLATGVAAAPREPPQNKTSAKAGSIRLLHGSGYLPQNTLVPWARYAAAGKRIGLIGNGNGGLEQAESQFNSYVARHVLISNRCSEGCFSDKICLRRRANQMSTAMEVPVENFVFIPLFGDLCPEMANDPAVAQLIESCDGATFIN